LTIRGRHLVRACRRSTVHQAIDQLPTMTFPVVSWGARGGRRRVGSRVGRSAPAGRVGPPAVKELQEGRQRRPGRRRTKLWPALGHGHPPDPAVRLRPTAAPPTPVRPPHFIRRGLRSRRVPRTEWGGRCQ
jgi:hypothetical protein